MLQTILVPKSKFSLPDAIHWVRTHRFIADKVDTTDRFYRFRQMTPYPGGEYRTKTLPNGVELVTHYIKII
jgi:hypothetical protein